MKTDLIEMTNRRAREKEASIARVKSELLFFEMANRPYQEKHSEPKPKAKAKKKAKKSHMGAILATSLLCSTVIPMIGARL